MLKRKKQELSKYLRNDEMSLKERISLLNIPCLPAGRNSSLLKKIITNKKSLSQKL